MRFAGSPGFLGAYGLIDSFDPSAMTQTAQSGRSHQNRTDMMANAAIEATQNKADAYVESQKLLADAKAGGGPSVAQSALQGFLGGLGGLGGASGGGGGFSSSVSNTAADAYASVGNAYGNTVSNVGSFMGSLY